MNELTDVLVTFVKTNMFFVITLSFCNEAAPENSKANWNDLEKSL